MKVQLRKAFQTHLIMSVILTGVKGKFKVEGTFHTIPRNLLGISQKLVCPTKQERVLKCYSQSSRRFVLRMSHDKKFTYVHHILKLLVERLPIEE